MRTKTVALVAAGALALTTVGGVIVAGPALAAITGAVTQDVEAPNEEKEAEKKAERAARIAEELAPLVEDGTLTAEQAAKVGEHLAESIPGGPHGRGHGGPPGLKGGIGQGPLHVPLETAAESLGMTVEELRTELKDGSTLGEIADAEGVGRADLIVALVAAAEAELAERVESGELTQAEADEIKATLEERIVESLDLTWPGNRGRGNN